MCPPTNEQGFGGCDAHHHAPPNEVRIEAQQVGEGMVVPGPASSRQSLRGSTGGGVARLAHSPCLYRFNYGMLKGETVTDRYVTICHDPDLRERWLAIEKTSSTAGIAKGVMTTHCHDFLGGKYALPCVK